MYTVEIYGRVRRAVLVEGKSERVVAQEFGIARETVRKMLRYSVPPGYRRERPVERPQLGPWVGGLPAPALPSSSTFSRRWRNSHRASSSTRALFTDGMLRNSKVSKLLTTGKRAC